MSSVLERQIAAGAGARERKVHRIWSNEDLGPLLAALEGIQQDLREEGLGSAQTLSRGFPGLADFWSPKVAQKQQRA